MPQVIPIIVYAAASYAGAGAITVAVVTIAASIAVAEYEKSQAEAQARQNYLNSLQDRLIQIRSGVATRGYIVGTVRVAGALLYLKPLGFKGEALDEVVAFANNECTIVNWLLNDDIIPTSVFPGAKYGRESFYPVSDTITVNGPNATVETTARIYSEPPHVTWRQAGVVGTASGTTIGAPDVTSVIITGLPAGSSSVTISYQTLGAQFLRGQFQTGSTTQTPVDWSGYTNPDWDSTHRLAGVCHARTLMIWDQNVYQNGAPAVTAVLTGRTTDGYPFYDPRDGSNPVNTTNPALVAGWWMTLPRFMGGMGIPTDWVDWTTVAAAANICDELISVKMVNSSSFETIKRYSCDTYLDTANSPIDNLNTILSSMAGTRAFTSGKYKIFAGAFRPAAVTLTDNDVVGTKPISVNTANVQNDPPNVVTAIMSDAAQLYQQSNPTTVTNPTYITADGYENPLDLVLNATTDSRRAQYLMGIALERGRPAFGLSLSVGGIGETLGLYDTVQLSLSNRSQYAGRTFEIVQMVDNWDGTFDLTLQESKATTYALDPTTYTPITPVSPTDNSYLWNPPDPTGFSIASVTPTTLPDGTAVARVVLTWNAIPPAGNTPGAHFDIRYRTTGGNFIDGGSVEGDSIGTTITAALKDGEQYQWELRFVNGLGAASNWVDAYTGISGTPLPTPLAMRISASSLLFRVPQTGNALPTSITLQIIRSGGLSPAATWSTNPAVTLGGSGDTRTLSFINDTVDSVQITATIVQSAVTYTDTVTISKVYDGANATLDLTAPPTPTGLLVTSFIAHLLVTWDPATFTMGHGYAGTVVYAAPVISGQSAPTFATAKSVGSSAATSFVFAAEPGTTWAIWIKWQTNDGVLSASPAGGTNGLQATATLIGTANLANDLITAAQLAAGSVGPSELAAGAIDATKFANSVQPVTIITGNLPGTNVGNLIYRTNDAKLYHWNGTTYTAQTSATDIAGTLTDAQLAAISAAKITGTLTTTQIGSNTIQTGNLSAASVTSNALAANSVTANAVAANSIGVNALQANSVSANALQANSVTAGAIATAAINARQVAAGAITTDKLFITGNGSAINPDPNFEDPSAWSLGGGSIATVSDGVVGTHVYRTVSGANTNANTATTFSFDSSKLYRLHMWARNVAANGVAYLGLALQDSTGANISGNGTFWYVGAAGNSVPTSWKLFEGTIGPGGNLTAPSTAKTMQLLVLGNYAGTTGYMEFQDVRVEEMVGSSLIVDGGIIASKLAANSIAVGTAAIQNGAIVNAMIGNAAIETANILDAAVQTLKIAGQAVTVPVGVTLASPVTYPPSGQQIATWQNVISTVVSNSGAPALILFAVRGINNGQFQFRIVRDSSVLWTQSAIQGSFAIEAVGSSFYLDSPGAGSHTYIIQANSPSTGSFTAAQITSLETKR